SPAVIPVTNSKESQSSENNKEIQSLPSESTTNSVLKDAVENEVEKVEKQPNKSNVEDRSVSTDTDVSLRRTRRDLDSNIVEKAGSISI
ncbi:hypothetical protein, partial [Streptococcus pneumoniae]